MVAKIKHFLGHYYYMVLNRALTPVTRNKQNGLTTVEYAVAGTLIALAVVAAFTALGQAVGNAINDITNVISP